MMRKASLTARGRSLLAVLPVGGARPSSDRMPSISRIYMPNAQQRRQPGAAAAAGVLRPRPGPPVAGEPAPVNMAYFGGHVQVTPKIYLVFWGWGQPGAFDHTTPGHARERPRRRGARMTAFIKAMGGTAWAGSQTQYYETVNGQNVNIQNPTNVFGGVWYDNTNPIHDNVSGLELAQEAQRAVAHFGVTDLKNSQFVDRAAAEVQRGRASTAAPATARGTTTRSRSTTPASSPASRSRTCRTC